MKIEITASEKSIRFVSDLLQSNFLLMDYLSWGLEPTEKDLMKEINEIGEFLEKQLAK